MELVLGRIGTVSGFFFGFASGLGGTGSALLGNWPTSRASTLVFTAPARWARR